MAIAPRSLALSLAVLAGCNLLVPVGDHELAPPGSGGTQGDGGPADGDVSDVTAAGDGAPDAPGTPQGPAEALATEQTTAGPIALDGTDVYFGTDANLMRVAKAGGAPVIVSPGAGPRALVVDALDVFWTNRTSGNLTAIKKAAGATPRNLAGYGEGWLTAYGTTLYFTYTSGSIIYAIQKDGTANTMLLDAETLSTIGVDADRLYLANAASKVLQWMPKTGGTPVTLVTGQATIKAIRTDATHVYWATDNGNIAKLDRSLITADPDAGALTPTMLATGQAGPSAMDIDDTNVYWTNAGDGTLMMLSKGGGTPVELAKGIGDPRGIAVDGSGVYFTDYGSGQVMVIRR